MRQDHPNPLMEVISRGGDRTKPGRDVREEREQGNHTSTTKHEHFECHADVAIGILSSCKHQRIDAGVAIDKHRSDDESQQEESDEIDQQQDILIGHGADWFGTA
jgi:hypothetical protein